MVTVTGEPLTTGLNVAKGLPLSTMSRTRLTSQWRVAAMLQAKALGQCFVMDENATGFKELLEQVPKINLVKDRGVFFSRVAPRCVQEPERMVPPGQ